MGDFGSVSWRRFEKFVIQHGCKHVRTNGDHRIYVKNGLNRPLVIPQYNPLPIFIILNNLRVLGVTKKELKRFLQNE